MRNKCKLCKNKSKNNRHLKILLKILNKNKYKNDSNPYIIYNKLFFLIFFISNKLILVEFYYLRHQLLFLEFIFSFIPI